MLTMHSPRNGSRRCGRRLTALAAWWSVSAALLVVAFAAFLAPPPQVQAQTDNTPRSSHDVLVSNTAETAVGGSSNFLAQSFETGANATGYTVTEIQVRVSTATSRSTLLTIREDDGGEPGALVATFINPASPTSQSLNTFTAPANTTLEASTTYWISVNEGISSSRMSFAATSGDDETGEMGWSIGNDRLYRGSETSNWETDTVNLVLAIKGTAAPPGPTAVPSDWSLIPTGLTSGDQFRLIFLSSTKRDGEATDIATYNTFIQTRAAAGHTDIQTYSDGFTVVGCTEDVDATANTGTIGVGVPIYWLNGAKVADDYADFYDEDWDEEAADKNELGNNGPNTNNSGNYPLTGCDHDGTEGFTSTNDSVALGADDVRIGRPNSSSSGHGPLSSNSSTGDTNNRPMYGLSKVFEVAASTTPAPLVSNTGQPSEDFDSESIDYAQRFTTGSNTDGYTLSSIDIGYNDTDSTAFSASIWDTRNNDFPNTLLYSLTPPATFSAGNLTFTAPANATLDASTRYLIVLALRDVGGATIKRTATVNGNEDSGAAAGWNIANTYLFSSTPTTWGSSSSNKPFLIAVRGTLDGTITDSTDATLSALTVNDGTNDLTLVPAFAAATYIYAADVSNAVDEVTLTATLNDDSAEVSGVTLGGTAIADTDFSDGITVPSLVVGDNEIIVTVTAEDPTATQTYTVTVTRAAANSDPTFPMSTADREVAENTAAGTDVGAVLTATDTDMDTLTYTLEGTDQTSFDLVTTSGSAQIRTKTGVTYNYEAKSSYTVVVKADDSNGGTAASVTVTITITDVNEAPERPAAPTVTATAGSTTSLSVSWTEPATTGPDIDDYDLRYRAGTSGNWTNSPQNVTATLTAIGSLDAGTSYQVQVRATNDEGDSNWSPSGTGATTAEATPTVTISADKTSAVFKQDGITYTLTRSGSTTAALPVMVTLTQTKDFLATTALSRTVTIAAGQSTKTFTVTASSFQHFAAGTMVEAGTLTAAVQDGADYDLGSPASVDVSIVILAIIGFDQASYTVGEAGGTLTVKLTARTGAGAPQPASNTSTVAITPVDQTTLGDFDASFVADISSRPLSSA